MKEVTAYGIVNYDTPTLRKSAPKLEGREYARYTGLNTADGFNAAPERIQLIYANCIADIFWQLTLEDFFGDITEEREAWCNKHGEILSTCIALSNNSKR